MSVVFSGIQPTGVIHLGNYLGAIKNWVGLQKDNLCLFCIVDLHSITSCFSSTEKLLNDTINAAAYYIACGIDPNNSLIFHQSSVPAHSELCWILSCLTSFGWLNRMIQFKEKSKNSNLSVGLFSYPVLMSADILLYKAKFVPVGNDQKQHLELSQQIALAFNKKFSNDFFPIPKPLISKKASRIMSLRDGTKKMSKSDSSDYSRINLNDEDDIIVKKIKKATTDSIIEFDFNTLSNRPEICNLVEIYSSLTNKTSQEVCYSLQSCNMINFKKQLSDLIIAFISPIRKRGQELINDRDYVLQILQNNSEKARQLSEKVLLEVKQLIGFLT